MVRGNGTQSVAPGTGVGVATLVSLLDAATPPMLAPGLTHFIPRDWRESGATPRGSAELVSAARLGRIGHDADIDLPRSNGEACPEAPHVAIHGFSPTLFPFMQRR
jgi:hypothetical protein